MYGVHLCMHAHMCRVQRITLNNFPHDLSTLSPVSTLPGMSLYVYSMMSGFFVWVLGIDLQSSYVYLPSLCNLAYKMKPFPLSGLGKYL